MKGLSYIILCISLKKNQNAPRPSEHPPVMGENMVCSTMLLFVKVFFYVPAWRLM